MIEIEVFGLPRPQARGRSFVPKDQAAKFKRGEIDRIRSRIHNPPKTEWHDQVKAAIREHRQHPLLDEAVYLEIIWNFLRPKSVKEKARPFMTVKPDIDNLEKLVKDAMKGIIYRDDSLVVGVHKFKQYAEPPGCLIRVFTMAEKLGMSDGFYPARVDMVREVIFRN